MAEMKMTCENCGPLLEEYRAEIKALRLVLGAVQERKKASGALIECVVSKDAAQWIVTCAESRTERLFADAVGQHIAKELGNAFRLVGIVMTGSSRTDAKTERPDEDAGVTDEATR